MNLAKIDLLTLPSLPLANRSELPKCPAIYFVLKGQTVLYIGRTSNLQQRWFGHHRWHQLEAMSGDIRIAWLQCSDASLLSGVERALIEHFKPPFNQTKVEGGLGFLHVKIDDDIKRRFKTACVARDRQMGEVVTELIGEWLQKVEGNQTNQGQTSEEQKPRYEAKE
ncbi:plasmid partition protein ParG [Microseira sp. BLCC-F43]|jgi:excinuclease UvrABC nuclease subunit|uniref:plasmid partition protein ParG n=1 Tax=Microseira sp. BLCC-F43 TaxID=3153602 RepID=UPI0035B77C89